MTTETDSGDEQVETKADRIAARRARAGVEARPEPEPEQTEDGDDDAE